ncbi:signal peptidase I [Chitinispirillales bacterium ANBcel5]|uniref:signal peptidase I n=1 Tax=Cellulosispirillum alkaliphilum TaxID=3039283 RepID=UPI002A50EF63|nr:signal peptidase I [Chitinispirillales bacterium ANBcel5]
MLNANNYSDLRISIYRSLKSFTVLIIAGLIIKGVVFDSVSVQGNQMYPTLVRGDRIVYLKTPFVFPFSLFLSPPQEGTPVIFSMPQDYYSNILRVGALSGNTVKVNEGVFFRDGKGIEGPVSKSRPEEILPKEYSPRDFMESYYIPAPGDTVQFSDLSIRDFFFSFSLLKQENPSKDVTFEARLYRNDELLENFVIENFSLYQGPLDSLPAQLRQDWLFWERLRVYLDQSFTTPPHLSFEVYLEEERVESFVLNNDYIFLLADNWKEGTDSRYFGPVRSSKVRGRPFSVLWSRGQGQSRVETLTARFGRFIK